MIEITKIAFGIKVSVEWTTDGGNKKYVIWYVNQDNHVSNTALSSLNASGMLANRTALTLVEHILSVGYENYEVAD